MTVHRLILPTIALALVLSVSSGAAETVTGQDRLRLWTGCAPVSLVVEDLNDEAKSIGLLESRIETVVRSRLRGARIYDDDSSLGYFYVNVNVSGPAFSVSISLAKWVEDIISREWGLVKTWDVGVTGTHGGSDSQFILSTVGEYTDHFVDEFLRVNADACEK